MSVDPLDFERRKRVWNPEGKEEDVEGGRVWGVMSRISMTPRG